MKANVIFFTKGRPTEHVWIYDARSNVPGITKKDRPLTAAALRRVREVLRRRPERPEQAQRRRLEEGRWRSFHIDEIKERDYKLDIKWLKDESLEDADELPEPQDLAAEAITELEAVVDDLREILTLVERPASGSTRYLIGAFHLPRAGEAPCHRILSKKFVIKVHALSDAEQRRLLNIIDELLNEAQNAPPSTARPIWEIFEQLSGQVPPNEWSKLPSDGAEQHDHYLYGAPKRKNP